MVNPKYGVDTTLRVLVEKRSSAVSTNKWFEHLEGVVVAITDEKYKVKTGLFGRADWYQRNGVYERCKTITLR